MIDALTQIIQLTQALEEQLEQRFGATGRGLHEKLDSVQDRMPDPVIRKLRKIATIRNQAVHENTEVAEENLRTVKEANHYVVGALSCSEKALAEAGAAFDQLQLISTELEDLLVSRFGATGSNLHEKLNSVAKRIPNATQGMIRKIATVRSKATNNDLSVASKKINEVVKLDKSIRKVLSKRPDGKRERGSSQDRAPHKQRNDRVQTPKTAENDPLKLTVQYSQTIEQILEQRFHATGRGLSEKVSSVQDRIPEHVCGQIHKIARLRNQAVHEDTKLAEENLETIRETYDYVSKALSYSDSELPQIGDALEQLLQITEELENVLVEDYGASGSGLHEKLTSVKTKVPYAARGMIRKIATFRSQAAHKDISVASRNIGDITGLNSAIHSILSNPGAYQRYRRNDKQFRNYSNSNGWKNNSSRSRSLLNRSPRTQSYRTPRHYTQSPKRRSSGFSLSKWTLAGLGAFILLVFFIVFKFCQILGR